MNRFMNLPVLLVSIITVASTMALAQGDLHATTHEYFRGKTLRIITLRAGGGFDKYSRAIARHIGKHLPGNPTVVVENMHLPQVLENLYRLAKPDALTIGNFPGSQIVRQLLGVQGIKFDARKFEWIGVPVRDNAVCALMKASGITSVKQWMASKNPVKLGGTRPGNSTDDIPKILKVALGLPIQLVTGYHGTRGIHSAAERGDVAGGCWAWTSFKATWRKDLESGDVNIVIQATPKALRDLPKVLVAIDLAKSEEARRLIQVAIHDLAAIRKLYALPPGTPKDLAQTLRKAFMATMNDKEFLAEAKKSKLDIDPVRGEEVERLVAGLFKMEATMVAKLRDILK
jgi:tripartite-type tricarboxylate transporter receptor subunit TctC